MRPLCILGVLGTRTIRCLQKYFFHVCPYLVLHIDDCGPVFPNQGCKSANDAIQIVDLNCVCAHSLLIFVAFI